MTSEAQGECGMKWGWGERMCYEKGLVKQNLIGRSKEFYQCAIDSFEMLDSDVIGVCLQMFLANVLRPYWRANNGGRKTS